MFRSFLQLLWWLGTRGSLTSHHNNCRKLRNIRRWRGVPCGISLQKEMSPLSHVQQLNKCKQPDLESPCPKLSNSICLQVPPREGGGRVSLAGPRTSSTCFNFDTSATYLQFWRCMLILRHTNCY